jgi:hypothetical protein
MMKEVFGILHQGDQVSMKQPSAPYHRELTPSFQNMLESASGKFTDLK